MLSERKLKEILGHSPGGAIRNIHWRSQDSTSDSILFYKITNGKEVEFKERISKASYGWLVINSPVEGMPENCSVIKEDNWPDIQRRLLDELFPLSPSLRLIGITGTNGKTTTTDLVLQLGKIFSKRGLSIGTLGVRETGKKILDFGLTSPSLIDLRKFIFNYGKDKDFCVMEVSSHALSQGRLEGIKFDAAGWLSFSQDHLDYHGDMESYFKAKCLIFEYLKPSSSVFVPAEQSKLLSDLSRLSPQTRSARKISERLPLFFSTRFNQNNLEVALSIMCSLFESPEKIDYESLTAPDGRFYIKQYKDNYIVVDFAHTPDALENICSGIKKSFPDHKLKVLFGCGGDRDRTKRPLMGKVVNRWADFIYVTSDNPRNEDPSVIVQDILKGIQDKPFLAIIDRRAAVKRAFSDLQNQEVLLLAGKGHEDYILTQGVKQPYSDINEVEDFIAENSDDFT